MGGGRVSDAGFTLMGVINVTPDSFSDGGRYLNPEAAVAHGIRLEAEGAAILDVGGESTRPGADAVATDEELRRVLPVIEGLTAVQTPAQISIDTSKADVAVAALAAGASMVNDVTAFRGDPGMAEVVAAAGVDCCLMHMLGNPRTMQEDPRYDDVVSDVKAFLEERMAFAVAHGVAEERILLDPGIGFGKTAEHNLELLRRLPELVSLGPPIVIGTSRKAFLGRIAADAAGDSEPRAPAERLAGTIATNVLALAAGARVFRVHDVSAVRDALSVAAATLGAGWTPSTMARTPTS
jgi:dihydropteroate synthase